MVVKQTEIDETEAAVGTEVMSSIHDFARATNQLEAKASRLGAESQVKYQDPPRQTTR